MSLKYIKEQPLLEMPPVFERRKWLEATAEDVKLMEEHMNRYRAGNTADHTNLPEMYYRMRELGYEQPMEHNDNAFRMRDVLNHTRSWNRLATAMETLYYLKEIGQHVKVTREDREKMRKDLAQTRASSFGDWIVRDHCFMRKLGERTQITGKDMADIEASLARFRKEHEGHRLLGMLYHMGELGLEVSIRESDKKEIERSLEEARRRKNGHEVAQILYWGANLPAEKRTQEQHMPPLREFDKR